MSRQKKGKKMKPKKSKLTLINLKVSRRDRRNLVMAARKYAGGNLSEWLRFAGMAFNPAKHLGSR